MKKGEMRHGFTKAIISFTVLSTAIVAVSIYFVFKQALIGPILVGFGLVGLLFLKFFKIEVKSVYPDIIFGIVDNSLLVFLAALGAIYAGLFGAILGGAIGDTIADGIGGVFEGQIAENQRKYKINNQRTPLSTMLGKMIGCLFGAGISLSIVWLAGGF